MENLVKQLSEADKIYNDAISKTESLKNNTAKENINIKTEYNSKPLLKRLFSFRERESIKNKETEILNLNENIKKITSDHNTKEENIKKIILQGYLEKNLPITHNYNISKVAFESANELYEQGNIIKNSSDNIENNIILVIKSIQHSKNMEYFDMVSNNKGITALSYLSNNSTDNELKDLNKSVIKFKTEVEKFDELSKKLRVDNNIKNINYQFSFLLDSDLLGILGSFLSYQNLSTAKKEAEESLEKFQKEIVPNVNLFLNTLTENKNRIADVYMKNKEEIDNIVNNEFNSIKKQSKMSM